MAIGDKFLVFGDKPNNFVELSGQYRRRRGDSKTATFSRSGQLMIGLLPHDSNAEGWPSSHVSPFSIALNAITKDLISPHRSPMGTVQQSTLRLSGDCL